LTLCNFPGRGQFLMNPDTMLTRFKLDHKVKDEGTFEDFKFINQTKMTTKWEW